MRPVAPLLLAASLLGGCGLLGSAGEVPGVVVAPPDPAGVRQTVLVELTDGTEVDGATTVAVGFRVDDLSCEDGTPVDPTYLLPGDEVVLDRVGDGDGATPPSISVTGLQVRCTREAAAGTVVGTAGTQLLVEQADGRVARLDVDGPFRCVTGGEVAAADAVGLEVRYRLLGGQEDSSPPGLLVEGVVVLCPPPPEAEG